MLDFFIFIDNKIGCTNGAGTVASGHFRDNWSKNKHEDENEQTQHSERLNSIFRIKEIKEII